jgi:heat shock protein HslJ
MKKQAIRLLVSLMLASLLAACSADSRSFRHSASPDLVGTEWTLVSLDGGSLIADTEITLSIQEAYLGGTMTCNNYGGGPDSGAYAASGESGLAIAQLAVTVQLCSEPEGIMEQEAAYIEALHAAATYRVAGDRLEIVDAGGSTRLVFQLEQ